MAAAVLLGGLQRRFCRDGMLMVVVLPVMGMPSMGGRWSGATTPSGGLFPLGSVTGGMILMIMGGLTRAAADRCGLVAAVAVVLVLGLGRRALADGLDGGGGVLMAAAGFAHDESLLDGSRRCEIFDN
ncbi:hypothetical protein NUITMVA1_39770 [Aeromonas hydrophila]|jgi:hypothetical protein|nr:hypothetical protein NUITMVA1_39770 [Aeromonas hydrophila]